MDPEQLIGSLLMGGLSRRGGRRHGHGLSLGRTILSPRGLTLLGGLAVVGYEYFKQKQAGSAGPSSGPATSPPNAAAPSVSSSVPAVPAATSVPAAPPAAPPASVPAAAPLPSGPAVSAAPDRSALAFLLIDSMVAAAKADGVIDPAERTALLSRTAELGAGGAEQAYLQAQLEKPLDLESIVSRATAAGAQRDVYTASLVAITVDTPAERAYLSLLAARLGLDEAAAAECARKVEEALGA